MIFKKSYWFVLFLVVGVVSGIGGKIFANNDYICWSNEVTCSPNCTGWSDWDPETHQRSCVTRKAYRTGKWASTRTTCPQGTNQDKAKMLDTLGNHLKKKTSKVSDGILYIGDLLGKHSVGSTATDRWDVSTNGNACSDVLVDYDYNHPQTTLFFRNISGSTPTQIPISECGAGEHGENGVCVSDTKIDNIINGTCTKTWNDGWSHCLVTSCEDGYEPSHDNMSCESRCVSNTGTSCGGSACIEAGTVLCDGSCGGETNKAVGTSCGSEMECNTSGSCILIPSPPELECDNGFHPKDGECISNTKPETIDNGTCTKTWNRVDLWEVECVVTCDSGFHEEDNNGACVSNTKTGIEGDKQCRYTWTGIAWGDCVVTGCVDTTKHVEGDDCVLNTRPLTIEHGTCTETWNGSAWPGGCDDGTVTCSPSDYEPNADGTSCVTACDEQMGNACGGDDLCMNAGTVQCDGSCDGETNKAVGTNCGSGMECNANGACEATTQETASCDASRCEGDPTTDQVIVMGDQTWSCCNSTQGSGYGIFSPDEGIGDGYGKLYIWQAAVDKACPGAWRVPSDEDFATLGTGMRDAKFAVKFPGYRTDVERSYFPNRDKRVNFWTTTPVNNYYWIYATTYHSDASVYREYSSKTHMFSVRCIKD